jgi:hypothetical protein
MARPREGEPDGDAPPRNATWRLKKVKASKSAQKTGAFCVKMSENHAFYGVLT